MTSRLLRAALTTTLLLAFLPQAASQDVDPGDTGQAWSAVGDARDYAYACATTPDCSIPRECQQVPLHGTGPCLQAISALLAELGGSGCDFVDDVQEGSPTLNGVATWGPLGLTAGADAGSASYDWDSYNCEQDRLFCNDGYYAARKSYFTWEGSLTTVFVQGYDHKEFFWDNCEPGTKAAARAAALAYTASWPDYPAGTRATGNVEGVPMSGTAKVGGDIRSWTLTFNGQAAGVVPVFVAGRST